MEWGAIATLITVPIAFIVANILTYGWKCAFLGHKWVRKEYYTECSRCPAVKSMSGEGG